ncbi:MAG: ATP-binding protein [Melioribacteraceae bacterium]|nr:MAG: ATP-binding protein [Melioribacteraceae bacterium]
MNSKEFSIASNYTEVTPVCKEIRSFCLDENIKPSDCSEIEICLIEALNNIVKHAYKEDFTKSIQIKVDINNNEIMIQLFDSGISRKEFKKPTLEYDPEDIENLPEGGMGLYIIDQLMDEISYKVLDGVNIFSMKKKF